MSRAFSRVPVAAGDGGTVQTMSLPGAWAPYALVAVLLVVTRVVDPVTAFLQSTLVLQWPDIFGTSISGSLSVLYLPGAVFVAVHLLTIPIHGMSEAEIKGAWAETIEKVTPPSSPCCSR